MSIKNNSADQKQDKIIHLDKPRIYIAQKTIKIICNDNFELIEGKEIPKGIEKSFIQSLISSNLIK